MKEFFIIFFLGVCFTSCLKQNKFDSIIINAYEGCTDSVCVVDLDSILDYDWDHMYVFGEGVTNEGVANTIGFDYNGDKDLSRLILFIENNQIVYEQRELFDSENSYKINFSDVFISLNSGNGEFKVTKDFQKNIYDLSASNRTNSR